ncbi:ATP-binding protein [Streptomyces caeruleatus]
MHAGTDPESTVRNNYADTGPVSGRDTTQTGRNVAGRDLTVYEAPAYPRLAYTREVEPFVTFYNRVFVGREPELARIRAFSRQEYPSYLLVEAPPGYGKTALVTQLLSRHRAGFWGEVTPNIVYFFIREETGRATPDSFLQAVNSQLLDLLGEQGGVPADFESQRSQSLWLWERAVEAAWPEKPLLLLVDGLDEMAQGKPNIAALLPSLVGKHVSVVVTSRPNPEPLQQVPLEHPLRQAEALRLNTLELADIQALLTMEGCSREMAVRLGDRVLDVTRGEPLMARFIGQDVAAGGERALADLERDPPQGVKEYFQKQFEQLDSRAEAEATWDVLGLLLVAHGAMTVGEMAAVLQLPLRQVRVAIQPIERFLIGRDRLELMHLELRAVVSEQFGPGELRRFRERVLAWGAEFAAAGWPDDTPDYLLTRYAAHLREADRNEELYRLVGRRWMELKAGRTHSHRSFARDVLLAIEAAGATTPRDLVEEACGSLVYATLGSLARNVPPELLAVLTTAGQFTTAEDYAALVGDPKARCTAYLAISEAALGRGQVRDAATAAGQALSAAKAVEDPVRRAELLARAAGALADLGRTAQATEQFLDVAAAMKDTPPRADTVPRVVVALVGAGQADYAVRAVLDIRNTAARTDGLAKAAVALAEAGLGEQALRVAGAIEDGGRRDLTLVAVVDALLATGPSVRNAEQALRAVGAIERAWHYNQALDRAVAAFARAGLGELTVRTITALDAGRATRSRAVTAAHVSGVLMESGQDAWAEVAAGKAVTLASEVEEEARRAEELARVCVGLTDAGQDEWAAVAAMGAVAQSSAIEDPMPKVTVLAWAASTLARTGRTERAADAAERVLSALDRSPGRVLVRRQFPAFPLAGPRALGEYDAYRAVFDLVLDLAEAGLAGLTFRVVDRLAVDFRYAELRISAAAALSRAGRVDDAVHMVRSAVEVRPGGPSREPGRAAYILAAHLARAGLVEQALRTSDEIGDAALKAFALARIAGVLADGGQLRRAAETAERAVTIMAADPGPPGDLQPPQAKERSTIPYLLPLALADGGLDGPALLAVDLAAAGKEKLDTLIGVMGRLSKAGLHETATEAAERAVVEADAVEDAATRVLAHIRLVPAFRAAGRFDLVSDIAERAVVLLRSVPVTDRDQQAPGRLQAHDFREKPTYAPASHRPGRYSLAESLAMELAACGAGEPALRATRLIDDTDRRDELLEQMMTELAKSPEWAEQLIQAAEAIADGDRRSRALAQAARVLADAGHSAGAFRAAGGIQDGRSRAETLTRVADALVGLGQVDQALRAAELALGVARHLEDTRLKATVLARIAAELGAAGMADQSVSTMEQALAAAKHVGQPQDKVEAFVRIVPDMVRLDRVAEAADLARQAVAAARRIEPGNARAAALTSAASACVEAGLPELAFLSCQEIKDARRRAQALAGLACALASANLDEAAMNAVAPALEGARAMGEQQRWRGRVLSAVARALGRAGRSEEALEIVREIEGTLAVATALTGVSRGLAEAGRADQAAEVAERALEATWAVGSPFRRLRAQVHLVSAFTAAGVTTRAGGLADRTLADAHVLTDGAAKARILGFLMKELVAAGLVDKAMGHMERASAAASGITDPGARARALANLARALGQAGRPEPALRVLSQSLQAARVAGRSTFLHVLGGLTETYVRTGNEQELSRIAERMCDIEQWWTT